MILALTSVISPELIAVLITSVLIFCARIVDVSIGTLRIISVAKGRKYLAPLLGFIEILIWLAAISQVMQAGSNPFYFIAYAAGFATGNYVGIYLEEKLALGTLVVSAITTKDATDLFEDLSSRGFGVTSLDAQGRHGPVKIIYTVIKRKNLSRVVSLIRKHNPKAFYSVEEAQAASRGIFPQERRRLPFDSLRMARKAK